jgi:ubiquinone/menaquinone biosynthesis C-methylase UbiE
VASTGARWLDVGTGTGLVARCAAARGYNVTGIDRDRHMIAAARRESEGYDGAQYEIGDARTLMVDSAHVVSAASLLYVVRDPETLARRLWKLVDPGGTLLLIETTSAMTRAAAIAAAARRPEWTARDRRAIEMWASARAGRAVDPISWTRGTDIIPDFHPLLDGLVGAWTFQRPLSVA